MNRSLVLITALLTFAVTSPVHAVKMLVTMTPEMAGEALSLSMKPAEGGRTRFTITRNPNRANEPTNPDLQLVRGATLQVAGEEGLLVRCPVASRENRNGHLVYQFELDDKLARSSRFALSEIEDYRPGRGLAGYIGGGTIYEFALIDFIEPGHRQHQFQQQLDAALKRSEQEARNLVERIREDGLPDDLPPAESTNP